MGLTIPQLGYTFAITNRATRQTIIEGLGAQTIERRQPATVTSDKDVMNRKKEGREITAVPS